MIRPQSGALPAIPATPALLPGSPLRHVARIGKLPAVNPRPATTIVASRSLHGAILSRSVSAPQRVEEKGTDNNYISNALFNCNPFKDETRRLFLEQFLAAHAGQTHQTKTHQHDRAGFGDRGGV